MALDDLELHALNLVVEEGVESHDGGEDGITNGRKSRDFKVEGVDSDVSYVDGTVDGDGCLI